MISGIAIVRALGCISVVSLMSCQSSSLPVGGSKTASLSIPQTKAGRLLYVSEPGSGSVAVLSYPQGKQVASLSGAKNPVGLCSDKQGHVFVVDADSQEIFEYMHGGTTAIATLDDAGNYPNGCAVDPRTGNLAVVGGAGQPQPANIAVYAKASGSPTVYTDGNVTEFFYCTYDGDGDLFASGSYFGYPSQFDLGVLRYENETISDIFIRGIQPGGAIQWDGKYLALESPSTYNKGPITIYQVAVSGSSASLVNTIELTDKAKRNPNDGAQFWIVHGTIASPEMKTRNIGLWRYPAGGRDWKIIRFPAKDTGFSGLTISD